MEAAINAESTASDSMRNDYQRIIQLRKFAAAVYGNLAYAYLGLGLERKAGPKKGDEEPSELEDLIESKHFADMAVMHNPHDVNLLHFLGNLHEKYGEQLLDTDRGGALRRARIYYRYAMEQLKDDLDGKQKHENAIQQETILRDLVAVLQELVQHYGGNARQVLEQELKQAQQHRRSLHIEPLQTLERLARETGKDFAAIRAGLHEFDVSPHVREGWIEAACKVLEDRIGFPALQEISERAIVIWATTQTQNYILEQVIGEGAYGVVFKGVNSEVRDTERAIKILDALQRTRRYIEEGGTDQRHLAIQEYRKAQLTWKNFDAAKQYIVEVVDIYSCGDTSRPVIVLEIMDGDFGQYQATWGKPAERLDPAKHFTLNIAEALNCLHNLRDPLYHRDLSPGNILFLKRGDEVTYKLADFGLSAVGADESPLGPSLASVYIRPPEEKATNVARDLYAAGCNIVLAYTGMQPFTQGHDRPEDSDDPTARNRFEEDVWRAKMEREGLDQLCGHLPPGLADIALDLLNPDMKARTITTAETLLGRLRTVYSG